MKSLSKLLFLLGFGLSQALVFAQKDSVNLTLLAAPVTPAAALLGITPSEVDKPRDPVQFLASLSNATDFFSNLPGKFAVEIAPAWVFKPQRIRFDTFCLNDLKHNVWQNLTLSVATAGSAGKDSTAGQRQVAFALKTSLLRGHLSENFIRVQQKLDSLSGFLKNAEVLDRALIRLNEQLFLNFDDTSLQGKIKVRQAFLVDSVAEEKADWLRVFRKDLDALRFTRMGWKLDVSAGLVVDFPDGQFDYSRVARAGAWLSGGYEGEPGWSLLGIVRWLANPNQVYALPDGSPAQANVQTFDAGGRLLYAPMDSRFTMSAEGVYRSYFGPDVALENNWKITINAEYRFHENKSLTFSYGRDFTGAVTRKSNLIALLSLFTGFGSEKSTKGMEKGGK